jgi:phosphopantothenoylcysteine decarboxylase/phosphopantothenate--cysteine ligase
MQPKKILLIVSASIAAYKSADLISSLKKRGFDITCVLTNAAKEFITPLTLAALSENNVYCDIFSLKDETEMGHIKLSRNADLIVVAPASCDIIAKMNVGLASDLASTILLAADKQVMIAPAMNVKMWECKANRRNVEQLKQDGVMFIGPAEGVLACSEVGYGKMAPVEEIIFAIENYFNQQNNMLKGYKALVTAGPTIEQIDPVRFISNNSSGKQGYAIAEALAAHGAEVTLISGPVNLAPLANVKLIKVTSAKEMLAATEESLPADIAIFTAAVADYAPEKIAGQKIKKTSDKLTLNLVKNTDILKTIASHKLRPKLVIGFAAETGNLMANSKVKLIEKNADYIIANDVNDGVFGSDYNKIDIIGDKFHKSLPKMSKKEVAESLCQIISERLKIIKK